MEELGDEEQARMERINNTIDLNDLAIKFIELTQHREPRLPLVGSLKSILFLYRASQNSNDIFKLF